MCINDPPGGCGSPAPERFKHKAEFLLQKGRCLNVAPGFSGPAEESLSRAVKLEPGLVEGWNTLGEQYWKKADLAAARDCFTGALQQVGGAHWSHDAYTGHMTAHTGHMALIQVT